MHGMQTILTNACGVCLSVSLSVTNAPNDPGSASPSAAVHVAYAVCTGSLGAAFATSLWPRF